MDFARYIDKYRIAPASKTGNDNVTPAVKPTHTNMLGGSYCVPDEEYDTFLTKYAEAYNQSLTTGRPLHLTEAHRKDVDYSSMCIDFDFRYKNGKLERQFELGFIKKVAAIYRRNLNKYLRINNTNELRCFATIRDGPYRDEKSGDVKDGFHLMFPIGVPYAVQHAIRKNVIDELEKSELLSEVPVKNKVDAIVDEAVIDRNNWLMYGSTKKDLPAYELAFELDSEGNEVDPDWTADQLIRELSIRRSIPRMNYASAEMEQEALSKMPVRIKPKAIHIQQQIVGEKRIHDDKLSLPESIEYIRSLVNILSAERADDYKGWFDVGACLFNIGNGYKKLLDLWIQFSKKSSKYQEGCCDKLWSEFRRDSLNMPSLIFWAKKDNPTEFEKLRKTSLRSKMYEAVASPTHVAVANFVHQLYKHQFVCVDPKAKEFYMFNGLHWERDIAAVCLTSQLFTEVNRRFMEMSSEFNTMAMSANQDSDSSSSGEAKDENKSTAYVEKSKTCLKIATQLSSTGFYKNIVDVCTILFYDKHFFDKLDANPNLLGVPNGVFDLEKGEFREGRPDDYISFVTSTKYIPYEPKNPKFQESLNVTTKFFQDILPSAPVRNYVYRTIASCFDGNCLDQKFPIFTGSGGNGKSILFEFLESVMGTYTEKVVTTVFTAKSGGPDSATASLSNIKGKRFISCEETEEGSTLNIAKVKEFTGGNKIVTRALYKEKIEFKPQAHWFLVCNNKPKLPNSACQDGGTWRRITVVNFPAKFVDNVDDPEYDDARPYVYKKDHKIKEKLENAAEAWMSFMLNVVYPEYKKNGLQEPEEIRLSTMTYRASNDIFQQYINERIEFAPDSKLTFTDLWGDFKDWHKDTGVSSERPDQRTLRDYMEKKLKAAYGVKKSKEYGWKGYRLVPKVNHLNDGYDDMPAIADKPCMIEKDL